MSFEYLCPVPASISDLTPVDCPENFGQITRLAFQRMGTPFPAAAGGVGDIDLLASWTALKVAADDTRIQIGPFQEGVVIPSSEAIEEGGDDNSTTFGVKALLGNSQPEVTGNFRGLPAAQAKELRQFLSESAIYGKLGVYFINEKGNILGDNKTGTEIHPFAISGFWVGSVGSEGFNAHNKTPFKFTMRADWDNDFKIIAPVDFDGNEDL